MKLTPRTRGHCEIPLTKDGVSMTITQEGWAFSIVFDDGGPVVECLAHKTLNGKLWRVTHRPSGLLVSPADVRTRDAAIRQTASRLERLGADRVAQAIANPTRKEA